MFTTYARQLLAIAIPLCSTKILLPLRGLAITWILSKLGTNDLAAGALVFSLMMAFNTFILGTIMSSVGVSLAYAIGNKDKQKTTTILRQGIFLAIVLSILPIIVFLNLKPIFLWLSQDITITEQAAKLAYTLSWMFIPFSYTTAIYKLLVNMGDAKFTTLYGFTSLILSVLLSYFLTLGGFGFNGLGIVGVGIGISSGYWLQAFAMFLHTKLIKKYHDYKVLNARPVVSMSTLKSMWKLGWPVGIRYNIESLLYFTVASIIGASDHAQLAAYQLILQLFFIAGCLSSAIGIAGETLLGQAIGGHQTNSIKTICRTTLITNTLLLGSICLLFILFPDVTNIFFSSTSPEYAILTQTLLLVTILLMFNGTRTIFSDLLVTLKKPLLPLMIESSILWLLGLPIGYFLSITWGQTLTGILIGLNMASCLSAIFLFICLKMQIKTFSVQENKK